LKFSVCLPLLFVYSLLFIWVVKNLTTSFVGMIAVCSIFLAFRYKLDSNNCFYLFSPSLEIYRKPKTNLLCRWHFVAIKIWYFGLTDATKTCLGSSNFRQKKILNLVRRPQKHDFNCQPKTISVMVDAIH
jgi:hypothetical protein